MIGRTLGRYKIVDRIGAGGMGEVYRAEDTELERPVAVKVLPTGTVPDESARKRFRKEALALAKLRHPHIGVIHDFGSDDDVDYLVMELVPGDNLSVRLQDGPLAEIDVIALGTQVTEALEEAHEQNIVHRDLKPHNIMMTPKGHAKVLDFGLAMLVRPVDEATTASMTELQSVAGTLPYMAPEQLQEGAEVDARTDIYALGVTLYEMATGRRPFNQTSAPRLVTAILREEPPSPRAVRLELSGDLERIVLKALQKDPERRYQTAEELRLDLQRLASGVPVAAPAPRSPLAKRVLAGGAVTVMLTAALFFALRDKIDGPAHQVRYASLAVLPFENLTGDADQDRTTDFMSGTVIKELGKLGGLEKVSSWQNVKRYRASDASVDEIGAELGVDALISAQVIRTGGQFRVSASLVEVSSDTQIWTRDYEGALEDFYSFHLNEVVMAIAREIRLPLSEDERAHLETEVPVDPEALRLYVVGRHLFEQTNSDAFNRAVGFYQQAIDIDSTFAEAYSGLADIYTFWSWGIHGPPMSSEEAYTKALEAAEKALKLDDDLAEAHASRAFALASRWKQEEAEAAFKRAIGIRPSYIFARQFYGHLLSWRGRHDEAVAQLRLAEGLAPTVPSVVNQVSWTLYYAGRFDDMIEQSQKALQLDPGFAMAHYNIAMGLEAKGVYEEAIAQYKRAIELQPGEEPMFMERLACTYAANGQTAEATIIVRDLEQRVQEGTYSGVGLAECYALFGELDKAFGYLNLQYEKRAPWLGMLKAETVRSGFKHTLESDPRFDELLEKIGI